MVFQDLKAKITRPSDDLTAKQLYALTQIKELVRNSSEDMELPKWAAASGESVEDLLCRFLKARKWDVKKAFHMLDADVKWRRDVKIDELVNMDPTQILGIDKEIIDKFLPSWVSGTDKMGRPILYRSYGGNFEIWQLTNRGVTVEKLIRYHMYENEQALRILAQQPEGKRASTLAFVVEAKGWHLGIATKDALRYIKGMAELDSAHYPERLGINICVNCPFIFTATWRVIRTWLDPVTVSKVLILGTNEAEWKAKVFEHISPDQLSVEFGGQNRSRHHSVVQSPADGGECASSSLTRLTQTPSLTKEKEPAQLAAATEVRVFAF
jgi:hypothetical protein